MMRIARDVAGPCLAPHGSVLAVGALDGLHRGHQALLARVRERAAVLSLPPLAISFEPLPRAYFSLTPLPRLGSVRDKIEGLAHAGMQRLLLLRFNAALVALPAEDFVRRVLLARAGAREVWVGEDFRFGHRRGGDLALLQRMGAELGFAAHALETHLHDGARISSSAIRAALTADDFAAAAVLLGHPFCIGGRVVRGQQLGRSLGYPTANIRLGRRVSPIQGIFAVRVHGAAASLPGGRSGTSCDRRECRAARDTGASLPGVASLGLRPTVGGHEPLLEAHLFDFNGDLYGRHLAVEFVRKLRDEEKFASLDDLTRQMHRDAAAARALLGLPLSVSA
ncbi:bifunctional riboflavin kinase/FAD synthetase [Metallibacterium sp.]|uniref:bifunctional riboflavin kinase/FAD synthetase n=1 Tax=Metallibacterium sp. TaxID=2940281 RepID=UPI00260987E2|nr:bifunctional riboflavin kinase/FAD synthetase [Metallibacterium sp.]